MFPVGVGGSYPIGDLRAAELRPRGVQVRAERGPDAPWLRKNGVNTNGAAAKVLGFDRLWKKARPGTFGTIKAG